MMAVVANFPRRRLLRRKEAELAWGVSEEADLPLTRLPIFTSLRPVPRRMQPALKNTMSELTVIASPASAAASELGANRTRVVKLHRVTAARLLPRVSKRTVRPVMAPTPSTPPHFKIIHPELIGRVRISIAVIAVFSIVARKVFVKMPQRDLVFSSIVARKVFVKMRQRDFIVVAVFVEMRERRRHVVVVGEVEEEFSGREYRLTVAVVIGADGGGGGGHDVVVRYLILDLWF
ncbi:hypothetical protein LINPERHAP1_LOCUS40144, partial [Linum perenne]